MSDDTSGVPSAAPAPPTAPSFALRKVPPAVAEEQRMRDEGMARALKAGAAPYRDAEGKARYVLFKEANNAPVESWQRDPRARVGYRRTQDLRKAAGQLIGQPGDLVEIAKRLGVLHYQEGSDIEGAAARGLHDAIWSREHVYHGFTVPRHYGLQLMDTGRIAAVAEEEARRLQAEDPKAKGGFWVRDRKNLGLIYVVPNAEPDAKAEEIVGGRREDVFIGQANAAVDPEPTEAENPEAQPAVRATSTAEDGTPPKLNYSDIPLPAPEPTWETPNGEEAIRPVINMSKDRIKNVIANEPAQFEIADSPTARSVSTWYESHRFGFGAVWIYQDILEYEATLQGVDPNLVKAIVYFENARGASYGQPAEAVDELIDRYVPNRFKPKPLSESILPMNIQPETWGGLIRNGGSFREPHMNIKAGVTLIRRITERLKDPSVAKVGSIYGFTGRETVSDNGARIAHIYETHAWKQKPENWSRPLEIALENRRSAVRGSLPLIAP